MPKQMRSEEKPKRWTFSSRCSSQVGPDDTWIANQMMDIADESTALGTSSIKEAVGELLQSEIFDNTA